MKRVSSQPNKIISTQTIDVGRIAHTQDIINELITEMTWEATQENGLYYPKRLPGGEYAGYTDDAENEDILELHRKCDY